MEHAQKVCRLCLKQCSESVCIFSSDIPSVIETLTSLKVQENDGLPNKSCKNCITDLFRAYETRKRIIDSDNTFRIRYISHSQSVDKNDTKDPLSITDSEVSTNHLIDRDYLKHEPVDSFEKISDVNSDTGQVEDFGNDETDECTGEDDTEQDEVVFKNEKIEEEKDINDKYDDSCDNPSNVDNIDGSFKVADSSSESKCFNQEDLKKAYSISNSNDTLEATSGASQQEVSDDADYEIISTGSDILEERDGEIYCKICKVVVKGMWPKSHRNNHMRAKCKLCDVTVRLDGIKHHILSHKSGALIPKKDRNYEVITPSSGIVETKNGKVYCNVCSSYVKSSTHRTKHMKAKCKICGVVNQYNSMRAHVKRHKSKPPLGDGDTVLSSLASSRLKSEEIDAVLDGNMSNSDPKPVVDTQEKYYEIINSVRDILEQKNGKVICKICNAQITSSNPSQHRNVHKKVKCKICGAIMKIGSINRHISVHKLKGHTSQKDFSVDPKKVYKTPTTNPDIIERKNGKYYCKICKIYIEGSKSYSHRTSHIKSKCKVCGVIVYSVNMRRHVRSHWVERSHNKYKHFDEDIEVLTSPSDIVEQRDGKHYCKICNIEITKEKPYLHRNRHMKAKCKICGLVVRWDNGHKHVLGHKSGPQICETCGKVYKSVEGLRTHVFNFHKDRKNYKCEDCGKEFKCSGPLWIHKRKAHIGIRSHQCDICGKAFFEASFLTKHKNMVHLKLRFPCEYCKKEYSSPYALKIHKRQHTGELPFICEYCTAGFRQRVSLRTHLKSKHNVVMETNKTGSKYSNKTKNQDTEEH